MLRMISLKERARVVFSTDDAVICDKEKKEEAEVLHFSSVSFEDGKKPVVFTVRLLNARERMQMAESANLSQTTALFTAAEKAICKIEGPGIRAEGADKVADALLMFDPSVIYTLAGWIMEQTSLKPDPLDEQK